MKAILTDAATSCPVHPRSLPSDVPDMDGVYRTYRQRVYKQCFNMVRNHADAEDLTQEVFLRLCRVIQSFRGESRFSTWLYRLTFNTVLMELRKQHRYGLVSTSPMALSGDEDNQPQRREATGPPAVTSAPPPILQGLILKTAIAELSPGYQRILVLHDVEGYGHKEISEILGINEGTSKSQLHKARQRVRELLRPSQKGRRGKRSARFTLRNRPRLRCKPEVIAA